MSAGKPLTQDDHFENAKAISARFIVGADKKCKRIAIATLLAEQRAFLVGPYQYQKKSK